MVPACGLAANKEGAWVLQNTIIPVMSPTRAMQASITWASGARTAIPPISISAGRPMAAIPGAAAPAHTGRRVPVAGRRSRDAVQAGARTGAGRGPAAHRGGGRRLPGDPFRTRRRALGWPHAGGAGLTSCPQRLWKSLGIAAVHVYSDVITRAWRRRSISVRSGARSLFTTPCDNRSRRAPRRFCFSHAMIPPRCSAFPCLFRHDCSRAFVARDGRAGRDDERGDGRRQARAWP